MAVATQPPTSSKTASLRPCKAPLYAGAAASGFRRLQRQTHHARGHRKVECSSHRPKRGGTRPLLPARAAKVLVSCSGLSPAARALAATTENKRLCRFVRPPKQGQLRACTQSQRASVVCGGNRSSCSITRIRVEATCRDGRYGPR